MEFKTYDGYKVVTYEVCINKTILNNINNAIIEETPVTKIDCSLPEYTEENLKYQGDIVRFYPIYRVGVQVMKRQSGEEHIYNYPSFHGAMVVRKPYICRCLEHFNIYFLRMVKEELLPKMKDEHKKELYELALEHYIQDGVNLQVVDEYSFDELKASLEHASKEEQKDILKQLKKYADNHRNLQYLKTGKTKSFSNKKYQELKTYCLK